ncbi:MAG TPA: hypothetical protein VK660_08660 [Xanthomonadaceae bacterium]|nr:hypothetical protein [Xanthomonadaceae bacterium]
MKMPRTFQTLASVATVALLICGQQALAQDSTHRITRVAPQDKARISTASSAMYQSQTAPTPDIYGLQATFTQVNPKEGPNADGTDLWPCFGYGSSATNLDCPTIGNPAVPFSGVVLGAPQYVWKLANNTGYGYGGGDGNGNGCDAMINGTTGPLAAQYKPCGQIATWYEDDSNDPADDLLQRIVVRQGDRIIYDSGIVDYGPAPSNLVYPVSVILNTDANFGYWPGAASGPNNGNCSPDSGYPLTSPTFPTGKIYVVGANQTCQRPATGRATFTTWTALATPMYRQATGAACKGGVSPCYKVDWIRNHEIHQDFDVFLE